MDVKMAAMQPNISQGKRVNEGDESVTIYQKVENHSVNEPRSTSRFDDISSYGTVVANHYNNLEQKGVDYRNKSRIVYMRNFNNWIKSILIIKFRDVFLAKVPDEYPLKVLDIGCGKGGDLIKWKKSNIRYLICADIAGTSVEHCLDRYENLKLRESFPSDFIVIDCTKANLIEHVPRCHGSMDFVSCQFSFHYCFESLSQAETMIRNISDSLRKGGLFIATCPDSNEIMSRLEASDTNSFGNEVFRIEFAASLPTPPPLFGCRYNFFLEGVVDCPEFLVHFPTLVKLCEKYGLELEYRKPFEQIYLDGMKERIPKQLFYRMKAAERFPAPPNASNVAKDLENEYSHATSYLEASSTSEQVLTISKSEWEVISLYHAFVFKKI